MTEKEKTAEVNGAFIARLGDLGLGNPEGIPSIWAKASKEELDALAAEYTERLTTVEDVTALACIDGRHTNSYADGSEPIARLRRVGGSAANLGTALNSESPILDSFSDEDTFGHQIHIVDEFVAGETGFDRSAHLGGCGGANGEIADQKAINENPVIMKAVEAFMSIPEVSEYLGTSFDAEVAERVRQNAGQTAQFLTENNWDGQAYVDGVKEDNAHGVEDLEVDHDDEKFHGHKESTLTIIIGDETLEGDDDFVWNLKASKEVAEALSVGRGPEGYTQALIAEIAKHMAVANRLPSDETPILLIKSGHALAA